MVSVKEALEQVISAVRLRPVISLLLEDSMGMVLAEDVFADRDFPPFDRVCMDGVCIHSDSLKSGQTEFHLAGMAAAGMPQIESQGRNKAIEVMTGAILPKGYDIVIPVEEIEINDDLVLLNRTDWKSGVNIHKQGRDRRQGDLLISSGKKIGAPEIGVMATVGLSSVKVYKPFNIAIVSTGDELVPIEQQPAAYQIRSSNSVQLASVLKAKGHQVDCFHINDDQQVLEEKLGEILSTFDMLILSGGVSKGKLDFVPAALEQLNVEKLFHRVAQKPGKPFWFGMKDECIPVFAFPGNPVSSFLCLHKYVLPYIKKSMGQELYAIEYASLDEHFSFKKPLTYFPTVELYHKEGTLRARLKPGQGSGDLSNLMENNAFIELDASINEVEKDTFLPVFRYR